MCSNIQMVPCAVSVLVFAVLHWDQNGSKADGVGGDNDDDDGGDLYLDAFSCSGQKTVVMVNGSAWCSGGMVLTVDNRRTWRKTCHCCFIHCWPGIEPGYPR
jgi:hypothetical protein